MQTVTNQETHNTSLPSIQPTPPRQNPSTLNSLPITGYLREKQLIGKRGENSSEPSFLPFSHGKLWSMVKDGTFPRPVKLSARITAWKVEEVREWLENRAA